MENSPYVYQTSGMVATQELRNQHIPCSQYIDDRHIGQLSVPLLDSVASDSDISKLPTSLSSYEQAAQAVYIAIQVLTPLGYF